MGGFQVCVWVVGVTWSLSFAYYTSIVLPYSAFDYRYVYDTRLLKAIFTPSGFFPFLPLVHV